jgi:hypothetical protein
MAQTTSHPRFRVNPVELAIFSVVCLILINSIYNLVYDRESFRATSLTPMVANPVSEAGRAPAATVAGAAPAVGQHASFLNLDLKCDGAADHETGAGKVRLTGSLCGINPGDGATLAKTSVVNGANRFTATVFTDVNAGKYSTDYIPLNTGKNPIHLEFSYRGGKVVSQDITVTRE